MGFVAVCLHYKFCILTMGIFKQTAIKKIPMILHPQFISELNRLGQNELIEVMNVVVNRLQLMQSCEYYLDIPVAELPLPPSVISVLEEKNIHTVRELKLYDLEKLMYLRHIGQKRMLQIKSLLINLEEHKEKIKTFERNELAAVLHER